MKLCLVLLLLATAVTGQGLSDAAARPADRPESSLPPAALPQPLGVNIHFTDPRPGEMEMIAGAGFRWVRMDYSWAGIEKAPGHYDFSAYDRLLRDLSAYRMHPIFILDYSNRLYDDGLSPHTEEGRQAFARWASASVRHFRGQGILWEMYNEPNIGFWRPTPDVDQYALLALAVGKAIQDTEPGEAYIGPATSLIDFKFLEACFKAGLLRYWTAVSVHPYRQKDPETAAAEFGRLRELIDRYAPPGKMIPIVSSEWGYSSGWRGTDEDRQARMLAREFLTNVSNGIVLSIWYDWHDDGDSPTDPEHRFGTVHFPYHEGRVPVYDPKPAYLAARTLMHYFDGYRFSRRLDAGSPGDYVLLFTKGRQVRLAAWTVNADHTVSIPAGATWFHVTGLLGDRLPDIQRGAMSLVTNVTTSPVYLTPEGRDRQLESAAAAGSRR